MVMKSLMDEAESIERLTNDDAVALLQRASDPKADCPFHGGLFFKVVAGRVVDVEVTRNIRRKKEAELAIIL